MTNADDPDFTHPGKPTSGKPPVEKELRSNRLLSRFLRTVFFGLLALVVVVTLAIASFMILFHLDTAPKTKKIAATDAVYSAANLLIMSGLQGPVISPDPDFIARRNTVSKRIRGGRGFTESGGFHGDGTDWYEVDLSPELAAELRANLSQSPIVKPSTYFPTRGQSDPSWWPAKWPAGSICYEYRLIYFLLPSNGTRLWIQVIRI